MTTGPESQCGMSCAHFVSPFSPKNTRGLKGPSCPAFPDGIPDEVFHNELDHRQPIEGDHGVRWQSNGRPYPEHALAR